MINPYDVVVFLKMSLTFDAFDASSFVPGFVNDILELRVLFSELMEVMSRNHYEQTWEPSRKAKVESAWEERGGWCFS